jgi:hypothetical protein
VGAGGRGRAADGQGEVAATEEVVVAAAKRSENEGTERERGREKRTTQIQN